MNNLILYKDVYIDFDSPYYPEWTTPNSIAFITNKRKCVAHLPDVERLFESEEEAKKYIDKNLKRIKNECQENAKKHNLPF